jgi:hypothetical protein
MSLIRNKEEEDEELLHKVSAHTHEVLQDTPVHSSKDINIHQVEDPKRMSDHTPKKSQHEESEDQLRTIEEKDQEQDVNPFMEAFEEDKQIFGDEAMPEIENNHAIEDAKEEVDVMGEEKNENKEESKLEGKNVEGDHGEKQLQEVAEEEPQKDQLAEVEVTKEADKEVADEVAKAEPSKENNKEDENKAENDAS